MTNPAKQSTHQSKTKTETNQSDTKQSRSALINARKEIDRMESNYIDKLTSNPC